MQRYNPKEIEPKWQKIWAESKIYEASDNTSRPKRYILEYFPYPSGAAMHVGHVRNYTIGDALSRHARMNGFNVLHPMGWDAFGLPAENYAIKTGISPKEAIKQNTTRFKQQLIRMGFGYDWSREITSSDPEYYRWTQWFFLLLYKRGLAYRKESLQWWCPVDKTVLANEQVENGKCWRCGSDVEKKALKQWFFKITDYAGRLEKDLDEVDWSDSIKVMQRNWIGRSKGAEIDFKIDGSERGVKVFTTRPDTIFGATFMVLAPEHPLVEEITTPEHRGHVCTYVKAAQAKSDIERQETNREKTGVFTGAYAINPANNEKIPVWVADYVLYGYGTGAIMAVPAHDERDYAFAVKFNLSIVPVVAPFFGNYESKATPRRTAVVVAHNPITNKFCMLDWRANPSVHLKSGLEWPGGGMNEGETVGQAACREFAEETGYNDIHIDAILPVGVVTYWSYASDRDGQKQLRYSIKYIVKATLNSDVQVERVRETYEQDVYEKEAYSVLWLTKEEVFSSQMWASEKAIATLAFDMPIFVGEGVMINSDKYDNLPASEAREKIVADLEKRGVAKERTNYKIRDWLISRQRYWGAPIPIVYCEKCGMVPVPENQLPVVLPDITSFEPSGDGRSPLARVPEFVNTTCPTCDEPAQRETDTMDGFACSSWYFLRFADPRNDEKPFSDGKVKYWLPVDDYIGGAEHAVMHLLYARMWVKVMQDAGMLDFGEPFKILRNQGMILAPDGQKMSKSKGNTIEPDVLIEQGYGADAIRIMELFIGPWNQSANWSVEGMGGSFRFLQRVWALTREFMAQRSETREQKSTNTALLQVTHRTIKKVSGDLQSLGFNTAIASLMEMVNELYRLKAQNGFAATADWQFAIESLLQLLAPFAPYITEELWHQFGHDGSIHLSTWPAYDEKYLTSDTMTIAVQVNGKVRAELSVATDASEESIIAAAKAHERVKPYIEGKGIKKSIYVPGRLTNLVV